MVVKLGMKTQDGCLEHGCSECGVDVRWFRILFKSKKPTLLVAVFYSGVFASHVTA
jgi:hypothetical protein